MGKSPAYWVCTECQTLHFNIAPLSREAKSFQSYPSVDSSHFLFLSPSHKSLPLAYSWPWKLRLHNVLSVCSGERKDKIIFLSFIGYKLLNSSVMIFLFTTNIQLQKPSLVADNNGADASKINVEHTAAVKDRHQTQDQDCSSFSLEAAITFMDEGIFPELSLEKFNLFLDNCRKAKSREYALHFHAYVHGIGFEAFTIVANSLVSMLVEVGSIGDAQLMFNRLSYRSESSLESLITGYMKNGEPHEALILYQRMQQECVHPNKHTVVAALKACAQLKDLESGCKIHTGIAKRGLLEQDVFVGSTLVDMYAKCGSLSKAQEVFDNLLVRNLVSWNALLMGYTKHGDGKKAIECYEQMQVEGISPDAVMLLCCLKACGLARDANKGCDIHMEICERRLLETDPALGNALVDMYAKCGYLSKAQDVFDNLPVQDLVTWTAMISGFAEHGDGTEALNYLERMQLKGISADAISFVCGLKACSKSVSVVNGQKIHGQIVRMGLERDLHVCSSLIDMYAKCGLLETAKEVLVKCSIRDVVSWNALVTVFSKNGQPEEVLTCFDQMGHEGVTPDAITFVCCLNACGSLGAATKGEEIYAQVKQSGLCEKDVTVANAAVDMFAKCGLFEKAHKVFNKIPVKDVASWNALIAGYVEHGHGEEALKCLKHMQLKGIPPNALTFVCCLDACGSIQAKDKGQELHAEISKTELLGQDIVVGNALIDMYVKCGFLSKAQDVFSNLLVRDVVSYNSIIGGYAQNEGSQEVLQCLTQMQSEGVSADSITCRWILKACSILEAVEKGLEIHIEIEKRGLSEEDNYTGNALVDMYAKCGLLEEAGNVFDKLSLQDVYSWNALIAGFVDNKHYKEALKHFEKMQQEFIPPDAVTFLYCLKACTCFGAVLKGKELHVEIVKLGLPETDSLIGSALVDMYCRCGLLAEARRVFDALPWQDVVSWTALIAGYVEHECCAEALKCFEKMLQAGISPDGVAFACCLRACGSIGVLQKGQEIHAEIARIGQLERELNIGNSLISMYGKCGSLVKAKQVFNNLSSPDIISWTALIEGYALSGNSENATLGFKCMIENGEKPNLVTFLCILNACNHCGLIDTGQMYFKAINEDYGLFPSLEHLTCVVDLLGRAGQVGKAMAVAKQMSFHSSPVVWHTLLGACTRTAGGIELGREFFHHATSLDDKGSAAYVCMSNISAEC